MLELREKIYPQLGEFGYIRFNNQQGHAAILDSQLSAILKEKLTINDAEFSFEKMSDSELL